MDKAKTIIDDNADLEPRKHKFMLKQANFMKKSGFYQKASAIMTEVEKNFDKNDKQFATRFYRDMARL